MSHKLREPQLELTPKKLRKRLRFRRLKDPPHLGIGQFEIEHVEILGEMRPARRFRNGNDVRLLDEPSDRDLCGGFTVSVADLLEDGIVENAAVRQR